MVRTIVEQTIVRTIGQYKLDSWGQDFYSLVRLTIQKL